MNLEGIIRKVYLEWIPEHYKQCSTDPMCVDKLVKAIAAAIRESGVVREWVSVKERLPEIGTGPYIVVIQPTFPDSLKGTWHKAYFTEYGFYTGYTADDRPFNKSVTHWTRIDPPLPQQPE